MSSGSGLPPKEHAAFAVISRLVSCLVTEKILRAYYIPFREPCTASGVLAVLSTHIMSEQPLISRALRPNDVFVIIPLRDTPVLSSTIPSKHGYRVGLADPLDMLPEIYELAEQEEGNQLMTDIQKKMISCLAPPSWEFGSFSHLRSLRDPIHVWRKFVDGIVIQASLRDTIEEEILSSFQYQASAYEHPPVLPTVEDLPVAWEQSLVAGHPTHPMHRARMLSTCGPDYDWYHPRIRFVSAPRHRVSVLGSFEEETNRLLSLVSVDPAELPQHDQSSVIIPVHEMQLFSINDKFPDVDILPPNISVPALGQSSIRHVPTTAVISQLPDIALKLAVAVKISSALRTISHFTADFGPRFSAEVVPKLKVDSTILTVSREPASVVYRCADPDRSKHLTAVFREEMQPNEGEALIVSASLLEMDHFGSRPGISAVESTFNLDTYEKRVKFLDKYIQLSCHAFLPPLIHNGVAFEAHAQNVLVRFDKFTGEPLSLVIRDLGGLRIHPETLCRSTGVDFKFLPNHCVATNTLEETYPKLYHTLVHNHLQRLIRVLRLHYDGRGWEILRRHMDAVIPADHELRNIWLNPDRKEVPSKCLMRMRMRDSYRDMVYSPYPNMIQYRPQELEREYN